MGAPSAVGEHGRFQEDFSRVILDLLPRQGEWSVEAYLWLTDRTNRLIEFVDGYLHILPMPTDRHQSILWFLVRIFDALTVQIGGVALFAPLRLQVSPTRFREPDLLFLRSRRDPRRGERYWTGADLVLEVVSPDDPQRDLVEKRRDYAEAGIPEYWIVDPEHEQVIVLRLGEAGYEEHGVFGRGDTATSALLPDLRVDVSAMLEAK